MFPGNLMDVDGFIKANGLDSDCEVYFIMKGEKTIIQRMKKMGPDMYKFLPLDKEQT